MNIGFIGLGKLGLPCAEEIAKLHGVVGYDIHSVESDSITIVNNLASCINGNEIIFIAVQTPHEPAFDGSRTISDLPPTDFDYSTVKAVLTDVVKHVEPWQTVVLISTVLPGTVREHFNTIIDNKCNFIYNPYLIAMGTVAHDMVNPEMLIIGTEDGSTSKAESLISLYLSIMENSPPIHVGTWEEAECIKIFYNTFISMKVSLVNMIQDVAEKNGNINVDVVTNALKGATQRITGPKYMTAGMGDAGPCHPRDNIALRYLAQRLDLGYDLFESIMVSREIQAKNIAEKLESLSIDFDLPIFIHGETYKPGVPYTEGSYSRLIASFLKTKTATYIDPFTVGVPSSVKGIVLLAHSGSITYETSAADLLYCEIEDGSIIVDPWRKFTTTNPTLKVIHYGNTRP